MSEQPHLDTGARALGALPADEVGEFDAHLASCPSCTQEYQEFAETVALLGAAVAEEPPDSLHRSVMRLIDITPQTPPAASPAATTGATADTRAARRWYRRPPTLLAAAVVALLLVTGAILVAVRGGDTPLTAQQCVNQAADARVIVPSVGAGGSVRFAPSCGAAVVMTPKMAALSVGHDYQLWVMAGNSATSAGLVPASSTPSGVVVPVAASDTAVGVSVEPTGGSKAPTTEPIWVVPLAG